MTAVIVSMCLAASNVIFISVDTLRADHLGCYGYRSATSPQIDSFAEQSLVFEDCICEVPLTAPSFGSMMTSRFPRTTGTHRNGLHMPGNVPLVAEQFRTAGYETVCVQSNWTLKAHLSGMNRGFDTYDDDFHKKRWGFIKPERYADEVTDLALECLQKRDMQRPLFLWVHYSDPHAPYRFHKKFAPSGPASAAKGKRARTLAKYDSEIAFTDYHIGRLLDALPEDDAYIVFVADHGESLYEHDYLGHGRRIYQTCLHIPFIIHGPGITPARNQSPVRGIDIGPTLLGLARLPTPSGMFGLDVLHNEIAPNRVRVIETYGGAVPRVPGIKSVLSERPPQRQGVVHEGWKLILGDKNGPELFELNADSMEKINCADKYPERVNALRTIIETWDKEVPKGSAAETAFSSEDIQALESLGYIE